MMEKTVQQFTEVLNICGSLFEKKLTDYGAAWRVLRPSSVTDQIYIKINRIRRERRGRIYCHCKLCDYRAYSVK